MSQSITNNYEDGKARKIHYPCDLFFAITWALVCGFKSPFPWFYSIFFTVMIIHRAMRDIERCREVYGNAWKEYERQVPYLFVPVSPCLLPYFKRPLTDSKPSTSSNLPREFRLWIDFLSSSKATAYLAPCHLYSSYTPLSHIPEIWSIFFYSNLN